MALCACVTVYCTFLYCHRTHFILFHLFIHIASMFIRVMCVSCGCGFQCCLLLLALVLPPFDFELINFRAIELKLKENKNEADFACEFICLIR